MEDIPNCLAPCRQISTQLPLNRRIFTFVQPGALEASAHQQTAAIQQNVGEPLRLPVRARSAPDSDLLSSFCPTPMAATLNDTIRQRAPGTSRWPFMDEMSSAWIRGSTDKAHSVHGRDEPVWRVSRLWFYGWPGCGRTVVTASIVEDLIHQCTPKHAVGYYFCRKMRLETTEAPNILRTLIAQLAQQSEEAFQLLKSRLKGHGTHDKCEASKTPDYNSLSLEALRDLLQLLSQCFEHVSLVINSLHSMGTNSQGDFVRLVASLADAPGSRIWIIFSSADMPGQQELAVETESCPLLVEGRGEDIRLYARNEIARRIGQGDSFLQTESTPAEIENHIAENSNGA